MRLEDLPPNPTAKRHWELFPTLDDRDLDTLFSWLTKLQIKHKLDSIYLLVHVFVARPVLGCIGRQTQGFKLHFPVVDSEGYHARLVIANRAAVLVSENFAFGASSLDYQRMFDFCNFGLQWLQLHFYYLHIHELSMNLICLRSMSSYYLVILFELDRSTLTFVLYNSIRKMRN